MCRSCRLETDSPKTTLFEPSITEIWQNEDLGGSGLLENICDVFHEDPVLRMEKKYKFLMCLVAYKSHI